LQPRELAWYTFIRCNSAGDELLNALLPKKSVLSTFNENDFAAALCYRYIFNAHATMTVEFLSMNLVIIFPVVATLVGIAVTDMIWLSLN
jgi:hypothetical protein